SPDQSKTAPPLKADGSRFEADRFVLFKGIFLNGQRIGTVNIESDLGEIQSRFQRLIGTLLAILVGASVLALALSSKLQGIILNPIGHLAQVAKTVSREKNYAIRAVKS